MTHVSLEEDLFHAQGKNHQSFMKEIKSLKRLISISRADDEFHHRKVQSTGWTREVLAPCKGERRR